MVAPAIQLFPNDHHIGLVGVRFPVELRTEGFAPEQPSTWPKLEGRLEFVGGGCSTSRRVLIFSKTSPWTSLSF